MFLPNIVETYILPSVLTACIIKFFQVRTSSLVNKTYIFHALLLMVVFVHNDEVGEQSKWISNVIM